MEIKGDIQKDHAMDVQHQGKVCPAVWLREMENNKSNLQQAAVIR